jgi:cell wall assembly regulator SMI1
MESEIAEIWKQIEMARAKSSVPECNFPMNPPATPDVIEQRLIRVLGRRLPSQLYDSLLIHNGTDRLRGSWFGDCGMLIPCSVQCIELIYKSDRQRAAEALAEGDDWANSKEWIPAVTDAIGEHTIYIDAIDESVLCYVHAGLFVHDYRYPSYLEFLQDVLTRIETDAYYEWPTVLLPPKNSITCQP